MAERPCCSMVLLPDEPRDDQLLLEAATAANGSETAVAVVDDKCAVCRTSAHKYKCPRCGVKTCSLDCCKRHKVDSGCNGQRDRTAFVQKEAFDEAALLSDYRFLEEQARLVDAAHRDPLVAAEPPTPGLSAFFDNLRRFVQSSCGADLRFMPAEATRHKQNKTRFNRNANLVLWSLEIAFHVERPIGHLLRVHTKANLFHSTETIRALLARFQRVYARSLFQGEQQPSQQQQAGAKGGKERQQLSEAESEALLLVFDAFKANFRNLKDEESDSSTDGLSVDGLNVLVERTSPEERRRSYVRLDFDKRLDEVLHGQTIVEYPTLFVVRDQDLGKYPLVATNGVEKSSSVKRALSDSPPQSMSNKQSKPADEASQSPKEASSVTKTPPVIQRLVSEDYELEEGELD